MFTLPLKNSHSRSPDTRDFAILQSKQQTWRTYGAGDCRVFDNTSVSGESEMFPIVMDMFNQTALDAWYQLLRYWRIDFKLPLINKKMKKSIFISNKQERD